MSYDLFVFLPSFAPTEREKFLEWFDELEWDDFPMCYDPANSQQSVKDFFFEIGKTFPALNGPYRLDTPDEIPMADYIIGNACIYLTFAWSDPESAYSKTFELAEKFGLGFFNVSSESGEVWLPNQIGKLTFAHKELA